MQYMLLIYGDEKQERDFSPEAMEKVFGAYMAYTNALEAAGAHLGGDALQPTRTATTARGNMTLPQESVSHNRLYESWSSWLWESWKAVLAFLLFHSLVADPSQ